MNVSCIFYILCMDILNVCHTVVSPAEYVLCVFCCVCGSHGKLGTEVSCCLTTPVPSPCTVGTFETVVVLWCCVLT